GGGFIQQVVDSDPNYYFLRQASAQQDGEVTGGGEEPTDEVVDEPPPPPPSPDECPPGTHRSPGTAGQCIPDEPTGGTTEGGGEEPPTIGGEPLTATFSIDSTNGDTAPATFLFEADAQGGTGPYTYIWNFGDRSPQGSGISIHHTFENPGTYDVTLAVIDSTGQDISVTRQVTVRPTTEQPPTNQTTPTNATTPLVQAVPQTTPTNQTGVKAITFLDILINVTEDGEITNFETSSRTINGTNEQLREQFAQLIQAPKYQYNNIESTTFINEEQGTAQVFGPGQATPEVFSNWFEETLVQMDLDLEGEEGGDVSAEGTAKKKKVWITICDPVTCITSHGEIR
ncbi:MAG: PKD domain-containing protein, partial [Nitrososphaera sp.]